MKTTSERIGNLLRSANQTLSTAESCTGGMIAHKITAVSGCSDYYKGSVVSYCNDVKMNQLGVSQSDLESHGAVSRPVVEQMAGGVRNLLATDYALATSGIAGPGGGTAEKPVGTVWMALATPDGIESRCCHFGTDRAENIEKASESALEMLLDFLLEREKSVR